MLGTDVQANKILIKKEDWAEPTDIIELCCKYFKI